MEKKIKELMQYINHIQPADGKSVLETLYEYHNEHQTYDNEQIRADFQLLYQQMYGMPLKEVDKVIDAVCDLCRDHERSGFVEGVKIGFCLAEEVREKI